MTRPLALLLLVLAHALPPTACVSPPAPEPPWTGPRLVIVGANGARLGPDRPYAIPLGDGDRALPLRRPLREALAVRNEGDAPLTVRSLALTPLGDTLPEELVLLAPTRAEVEPLVVADVRLAPGEQLDLDVAVWPAVSGLRRAALTVRWAEGTDLAVELRARGEGDARLWDPAVPLPGPRLVPADGAALTPVAVASANGNAYLLGDGEDGATVARVLPDDRLAWVVSLPPLVGRRFVPFGLCARDATLAIVGELTGDDVDHPAVVALDAAGTLRWARTWQDVNGSALQCALDGPRVWVAGVVHPDTPATSSALTVLAAQSDTGALVHAWRGEPDAEPLWVSALEAGRDEATAWLGGAVGKRGFTLQAGPEDLAGDWLPGPVEALTAAPDGALVVAWGEPRATVVARLDGDGPRWTSALPPLSGVRLAVEDDALVVAGRGEDGWSVFWLAAMDGGLQDGASLVFAGAAPELASMAAAQDGIALAGVDGSRPHFWARAPTAWHPRGLPGRDPMSPTLAPVPATWTPTSLGWKAQDTVDRLAAASADDAGAFVLSGLRRGGSE
ncbi:MAG: hypothetical protein EP329_22335 [Deltaproteobacteria bacterium]|nr:MAG: hypothetical protein EP329_22335 [Deltaproteobacteria bacterium]